MATSPRDPQLKFEPWKDPDAQPYVRIDRVTKKFGDFIAVDDVSLGIFKKEIFCLLGASGCACWRASRGPLPGASTSTAWT